MSNFNTFYKTFSGSDTLVFILIPNTSPIVLGSLSTISYSTYRVKRPVTTLGRVNVSGFTRGQRTVAGTMIFTLINQHWVNEVVDSIKCLSQFDNLKPDELPLFDLMIVAGNEYGSGVVGYVYGVDITDDSGVISVNDYYTETTVSYLARDIELIKDYRKEIKSTRDYGDSQFDKYYVDINGSSNVVLPVRNHCKEHVKSIDNIDALNKTISIDNLDMDHKIIQCDSHDITSVMTISHYGDSHSKKYMTSINRSYITVSDVIDSFMYNIDTMSYPKNIECIIRADKIIKLNINLNGGE